LGPLDFLVGPLRSLVRVAGQAEREMEHHSPITETRHLEARLEEAVAAVHRAADSMERHVAVVGSLTSSLPALTESVRHLSAQLNELMDLAAPLESAERDVSRLRRLFGRRRPPTAPSVSTPAPE
jgi:cell shape-determining protein MreC